MMDLYRFLDANDRLLYIGISLNAVQRAVNHRNQKNWWNDVNRMDIEHLNCQTRDQAEAIEAAAIIAERPLHNIEHNSAVHAVIRDARITWLCDHCGEPIADRCGYVGVGFDRQAIAQAFNDESVDAYGDAADVPTFDGWQSLHSECEPPSATNIAIPVDELRTISDVLHWTAHLSSKPWYLDSDWLAVLEHLTNQYRTAGL